MRNSRVITKSSKNAARRQRGVTLVELMVVLAILAILVSLASYSLKPGRYANDVLGFADSVATELDAARWRATSTARWQMVTVTADQIWVQESLGEGMQGLPLQGSSNCVDPQSGTSPPFTPETDPANACWRTAKYVQAPRDVQVVSVDSRPHLDENDGVPADGSGLTATLLIAPDGSVRSNGWTLFISNSNRTEAVRVLLYRASGSVSVLLGH